MLRCGSLIINDAPEKEDEQDDEDEDESGEPVVAIPWRVPDGFKVATQPARIDESAVGRFLYLNWKDYGWSLGKVTELITKSTPLLFKKYNVRAIWAVEGRLNKKCKGPCMPDLILKMYKSGADAQLDSWVFLDKSMAASDE